MGTGYAPKAANRQVPARSRKPAGQRRFQGSAFGERIVEGTRNIWQSGKLGKIAIIGLPFAAWTLTTVDHISTSDRLPGTGHLPSPLDVTDSIGKLISTASRNGDGFHDTPHVTAPKPPTGTAAPATATETPTAPVTGVAETAPPATIFGQNPITAELPTTTAPIEVELPATIPAPVGNEALPNPVSYSAAAGSVACSGPNVHVVHIIPGGEAPLTSLENATGEPWTQSATGGANPLDEQLFNEVLATKKDLGDGTYEVTVRDGCVGLEQ